MMMLEKLEDCPACGEVKGWLYDSQLCSVCGYGDPQRGHSCDEATQEFRLQNDRDWREKLEHVKAERDRYLAALAWIATFNTDPSSPYAADWLQEVVDRARREIR